MKRDGWQSNYVIYEGGGRISQGCDGVVTVSRVLGFVRSRTPVEVEKEVRLGEDLPTRYQGGTVGGEGGDGLGEVSRGRVYFWGGADKP